MRIVAVWNTYLPRTSRVSIAYLTMHHGTVIGGTVDRQ